VSRLGLGSMGMSAYYTGAGVDDAESIRTIRSVNVSTTRAGVSVSEALNGGVDPKPRDRGCRHVGRVRAQRAAVAGDAHDAGVRAAQHGERPGQQTLPNLQWEGRDLRASNLVVVAGQRREFALTTRVPDPGGLVIRRSGSG
jgi:hypothetical protein